MLFLLSGLGPGSPVSDRTGAERLNASRGAVRLYGLSGSGAPLLPGQALLFHWHDQGDRPLPLGAGNGPERQGGGAGLLGRCRGLRHGKPSAGAGRALPGRDGGGGARPDRRPERRCGAGCPLAHDFCVLSLSDRLTPWEVIERRLAAAAIGDFCIALYNPSSKGRPDYLARAVRILLANGKAPGTVCGIVRNIGREGQESRVLTLAALETTPVDMFTTVFVGNAQTRQLSGRMVTPRGYRA